MQQKYFIITIKDAQLRFETTNSATVNRSHTLEQITQEGWQIICINDFTDKATRNKYTIAICRKD